MTTRHILPAFLMTFLMTSVVPADEKPHPYFQDCGNRRGASTACDVSLVDQNGRPVSLYRDLLQGRVVVINAFFTTCKDSCPVMARNFAALQTLLGDKLGKQVFLLSFTVDPENDTPARLKAYAESFKAKPGWTFLTGKKENVDWALYKLGQYVEQKQDHLNLFVIGNEKQNYWTKIIGIQGPEKVMEAVRRALLATGPESAAR
jgi:protein SCO1